MARPTNGLVVWQWNCRGFTKKQPLLQQYVRHAQPKPDVIMIQETVGTIPKIPGFTTYASPTPVDRGLAILTRKGIVVQEHSLRGTHAEHMLVELLPNRTRKCSVFLLNVYSNPAHSRSRFLSLFRGALALAGVQPFMVGGDFNAPNEAWGYGYTTAKGRRLWQDLHDAELTLITDHGADPHGHINSTGYDAGPDGGPKHSSSTVAQYL